MKKKLLLIIFLLIYSTNVIALNYKGCDSKDIAALKSFVNNVNLSYDYKMVDDYPIFSITINNITPNMYFKDTKSGKIYRYSDTNNGEIVIDGYRNYDENGSYRFYSEIDGCNSVTLGSKYYKLPSYNEYYEHEICKDNRNLTVCKKWINNTYTLSQMKAAIYDYYHPVEENEIIEIEKNWVDKIVEFYVKYYYLILLVIIIICSILIFIKRKKDSFNLKI